MRYILETLKIRVCHRSFSSSVFASDIFSKQDLNVTSVNPDNQFERLSNVITPLKDLDYKDQLQLKHQWSKNIVKKFYEKKIIPRFKTQVLRTLSSPVLDSYRNKDEFSIRCGIDGHPKTVGFFIGSPSNNEVVCVPPTQIRIIRKNHVKLAQLYQDFIQMSPLKACHDLHDGGFWRNIIVRSNNRGDTMGIVIVHPRGASESELGTSIEELSDFFRNRDVNSFFYQSCLHTKCTNEQSPFNLLFGDKYIYEKINGFKFQISPDSFFQVNTAAAEILYSKIIEKIDPNPKSTLFDLCCGTGTLSILASSHFRGCVGIDVIRGAIKDAVINSRLNGVNNCNFIVGPIEKKFIPALKDHDLSSEIVAVLNPGRAGVLKSVIKALRNCLQLRRLVYVSCKADSPNTMKNFIDLCNPKFDTTNPFVLTEVQPVDMFPHTKHCELIMVFQR